MRLAERWQDTRESFRQIVHPQREKVKSKHSIFESSLLAKRFSQNPEYQASTAKEALLIEDLNHIAQETMLGQIITSWETIVYPDQWAEAGNYREDLGAMTHAFIDTLAKNQQNRAMIEDVNMSRTVEWALANQGQSKVLIWTSPPDTKAEGYHGATSKHRWRANEKHHSFFYVMRSERIETENGPAVKLITDQVRGWPNMQELIEIQTALNPELVEGFKQLKPNDGQITHHLINNLIELEISGDYQTTLSELMETIFASQKEWLFSPKDMPVVDQNQFWQEFDHLNQEFYLVEAMRLFNQVPVNLADDDEYWYSNEYENVIEQLDLLFNYWQMSLHKWVETHDENPASQTQTLLHWLKNWKQIPLLLRQQNSPEPDLEHVPVNTIGRMFSLHSRSLKGEKLSPLDRSFFLTNLNTLSIAGRAFSLAQCGIFAPFSVPLNLVKNLNSEHLAQLKLSFEKLPFATKQELLTHLKDYVPTKLPGVEQQFMVPKSYVGQCWVENGQIIGPCGIPLNLDPEALPFQPSDLASLINSFDSSLDKAGFLTTLSQKASTPFEQQQAKLILKILDKSFKNSIGLTDLINNATEITLDGFKKLPAELLNYIRQSRLPFSQLIQEIMTKLQSEYGDWLSSLPEFRQLKTTTSPTNA